MVPSRSTLCIIPARGGSKGIPGKNMVDFCGKPLLAWTLEQARMAVSLNQVAVSSDDLDILALAKSYGCLAIPRPTKLSTDTATSEAAISHVLDQCPTLGVPMPEVVVFLQATSPLRAPTDIDDAVRQWHSTGCDSLFSCSQADDFCLWGTNTDGELESISYDARHRDRRQDRPRRYLENGSIYVFSAEGFRRSGNRLFGRIGIYSMPLWQSFEIDDTDDLDLCRSLFRDRLLQTWQAVDPQLAIAADAVDLLVYDFDGVMTDNRALVMTNGSEGVTISRADGLGVSRLKRHGFNQVIMSTESNPVVHVRGKKLGLETHAPVADKGRALGDLCRDRGIDLRRVVFVGNDLNDADAMGMVGYPIAPSDAHPTIRAMAHIVTRSAGGAGVIRELADAILGNGSTSGAEEE